MTKNGLLGAFGTHAFLEALSEQHLMRLAANVRPFTAAAGEFLAREGAKTHAFYLVQSGHVQIGSHGPGNEFEPLAQVGPGEVVGWSWLLKPHRWQFDCRAADRVQGLMFDADWLREQCESDHELGYHLLKHLLAVVASRLAATRLVKSCAKSQTCLLGSTHGGRSKSPAPPALATDAEVTDPPASSNLGMKLFVLFAVIMGSLLIIDLLRGGMRFLK